MWKAVVLGLVAMLLLTACGASSTDQQNAAESDSPTVTLYKSPT